MLPSGKWCWESFTKLVERRDWRNYTSEKMMWSTCWFYIDKRFWYVKWHVIISVTKERGINQLPQMGILNHLWTLFQEMEFTSDAAILSSGSSLTSKHVKLGKLTILRPVYFLGNLLLAFALLHFVPQVQTCLLLQDLLTFYFGIPVPYDEKDLFFWC